MDMNNTSTAPLEKRVIKLRELPVSGVHNNCTIRDCPLLDMLFSEAVTLQHRSTY